MPTPTVITDLSQTAASNYPAGTDSPSVLDDVQRAHASFIALLRDGKGQTTVKTIAGGATTDVGGENSLIVEVTGTPTITSLGTNYNGPRFVRFTGAAILTHNATLLNLPGATNITTVVGDSLIAVPNSAGNGWNVISYARSSGVPATYGGEIGGATATTAALGDNSTKVATTAFVRSVGPSYGSITGFSANTTLTSANYGNFIYVNGTFTLTLPVADAANVGRTITCYGYAAASVTVATQSSQFLHYQGTNTATSAVMIGVGDTVTFVNYSGTAWMAMGANALGTGQTYSNVTGSRVLGTTYTNTTGKPIFVIAYITFGGGAGVYNFNVSGSAVATITGSQANGALPTIGGIVPTGATYSVSFSSGSVGTLTSWTELR